MAYTHFNESTPAATQSGPDVPDSTRENLKALRDGVVGGLMVGWEEAIVGGVNPTTITLSKGLEKIRQTLTWGTAGGENGNVTKVVLCYSFDSGSNWDYMGTENTTYDSEGNVTAVAWTTGDTCS